MQSPMDLILATISEAYPKYLREKLIKKLEEQCVISKEHNLLTETAATVQISQDDTEQKPTELDIITQAMEAKNEETITVIESLEYGTSYKYSTLLQLNEFPEVEIEEAITSGHILDSSCANFISDYCSSFMELDIIKPSYKKLNDNLIALKFNQILSGRLPSNGNAISIKYPLIVLFYKDINIIEIRFDSVKGYLKNDDFFYSNQIDIIIEWLEKFLTAELFPLDLKPVVEFISKNNSKEVDVAAQAMNMKSGSKAVLDTGVNDSPVLPLLGELKELIDTNDDLFKANEQTLAIEEKLTYFIKETEETSDLPWISLRWNHQTKSKAIKVKFSFNFKGQVYDLLQYYGNNAEMGEMNNVTKYIIKNKTKHDLRELESEETEETT